MTVIADTNEFHPLTDAVAYRDSREADGTNHPIIIMRATYSNTHVDFAYTRSLRIARAAKLYVGHYGYMVSNVDPAAQGKFFGQIMMTTGGFHIGDSIWCDDEEGTGDQSPRAEAWLDAVHGVIKDRTKDEGVYSGAAFWKAHLNSMPTGPSRWVAAYGQGDPRLTSEDLWQFTDNREMAGVSGLCDASIFMGDVNDWLKLVGAVSSPSSSSGTFLEDLDMEQLAAGERFAYSWQDGAKTIRITTDAPVATPVPWHIAWYADAPNSRGEVAVGDVNEPKIPGGRGAMVHRDDKPMDPTAQYQFHFIAST
jgi:hypothetical protein